MNCALWENTKQILENRHCKSCLAGQAASSTGSIACISCEKGNYNDVAGQINCKHCPGGQYQNEIGMLLCKSCSKGQFQPFPKQDSCSACPTGRHAPYTHSEIFCTLCAPGRYESETGSSSCKTCPADCSKSLKAKRHVMIVLQDISLWTPQSHANLALLASSMMKSRKNLARLVLQGSTWKI